MDVEEKIHTRIRRLNKVGRRTSKGERFSLAAIGRTLDPPVSPTAVHLVVKGKAESARIKDAVQRELDEPYWPRLVK